MQIHVDGWRWAKWDFQLSQIKWKFHLAQRHLSTWNYIGFSKFYFVKVKTHPGERMSVDDMESHLAKDK